MRGGFGRGATAPSFQISQELGKDRKGPVTIEPPSYPENVRLGRSHHLTEDERRLIEQNRMLVNFFKKSEYFLGEDGENRKKTGVSAFLKARGVVDCSSSLVPEELLSEKLPVSKQQQASLADRAQKRKLASLTALAAREKSGTAGETTAPDEADWLEDAPEEVDEIGDEDYQRDLFEGVEDGGDDDNADGEREGDAVADF